MKSIQRRFNNISEAEPGISTYMAFAKTVKGQRFSRSAIMTNFRKLVEKDDYLRSEKDELITHLCGLANPS